MADGWGVTRPNAHHHFIVITSPIIIKGATDAVC
jgi:hypothetical protein